MEQAPPAKDPAPAEDKTPTTVVKDKAKAGSADHSPPDPVAIAFAQVAAPKHPTLSDNHVTKCNAPIAALR